MDEAMGEVELDARPIDERFKIISKIEVAKDIQARNQKNKRLLIGAVLAIMVLPVLYSISRFVTTILMCGACITFLYFTVKIHKENEYLEKKYQLPKGGLI